MRIPPFRVFVLSLALVVWTLAACSSNTDDDGTDLVSSSSATSDSLSSSSVGSSSSGDALSSSSVLVVDPDTLKWVGNPPVLITEITTINVGWPDHLGEEPGWIELYNYSASPVNLKGLALVEKLSTPRKWVFGDVLVPAKGFITVFCDKLDLVVAPTAPSTLGVNRPHTNYKLEKDSGALYLVDSTLGIRDSVQYPVIPSGASWGMGNGGKWAYYDKPTPEAPNTGTSYGSVAPAISFATSGGFYDDPVTVAYPTAAGSDVRCTQDGSIPTANSAVSTGTVLVSENTVIRCAAFQSGALRGAVSTQSYFIGETPELPVVSIAVDPVAMFDQEVGLYSFGPGGNYGKCNEPCKTANFWKEDELPVHVDFFEKNGNRAFAIDAGLQIMGQWSRYNPKKSVSITMRDQYEDGRIQYAIFPEFPQLTKFKAFNLRNNGNRFGFDYYCDAMATSLLQGTGVDYQKSRQVIVFYNGAYYGIHDMREKLDEHFVESNYGIASQTVDAVKHVGDTVTANGGTNLAYISLLDYVASANLSDTQSVWSELNSRMDLGNFADYMASGIYFQNSDWPNNNVRAWRANSPAGPFHWMMFDVDHGFGFEWAVGIGYVTSSFDMFKYIDGKTGKSRYMASFFTKLLKIGRFREMFVNRSAVLLSYWFTPERVNAAIDKKNAEIPTSARTRDLKRFPYFGSGLSSDRAQNMSNEPTRMHGFADARTAKVRDHYRSKFSLGADAALRLVASGAGTVRVHGMALPSQDFSADFFADFPVELTAVPNDGATFLGWSDGVTTATRRVLPGSVATLTAQFR